MTNGVTNVGWVREAERATPASQTDPTRPIAVLGAGQMGTGIAHALLAAGYNVTLLDSQPAQLDKAQGAIRTIFAGAVQLGKITEDEVQRALARLATGNDMEAGLRSTLFAWVIESVVESLAVKTELLALADRLLPPDALLASNTSALSITELAAATQRPERCIGLHFFNPVHKMKLLEVVRGLATGEDTVRAARALGERLKKNVVVVNDSPGMTTSRMSALLGNEAMTMLQEGLATAEDIDASLRGGLNHPMGPLELGDLTGWDTRLAVLQYLHRTLGEKYRPCPLITKMVAAGHTGRKTGRGVYRYENGERVPGSGLQARP